MNNLVTEDVMQMAYEYAEELIRKAITNENEANEIVSFLSSGITLKREDYDSVLMKSVLNHYDTKCIDSKEEYMNSLAAVCSFYYNLYNSLTFVCNTDKIKLSNDKVPDNIISLISSLIKEYNYSGIAVNIVNGGKSTGIILLYNGSLLNIKRLKDGRSYTGYVLSVCLGRIVPELQLIYIPELYPKLFIPGSQVSEYKSLLGTQEFNYMEADVQWGSGDIVSGKLAIAGYNARNKTKISASNESNNSVYIEELLNAVYYCLNKFLYRGKKVSRVSGVSKASSKEWISEQSNSKVHSDILIKAGNKYIKLGDIGKIKGSSNNVIRKKSVHHNSPCEHQRKGHWRMLKSGKRVYVRGTIVNKGSRRAVYVV